MTFHIERHDGYRLTGVRLAEQQRGMQVLLGVQKGYKLGRTAPMKHLAYVRR